MWYAGVLIAFGLLSGLYAQNVGIGTATPTERLHVAGNLRLDNAFMPGNQPGAVGNLLLSQGAGVAPVWLPNGAAGSILMSMGPGANPVWAPNPICPTPTVNRFLKFTATAPTVQTCNTTLAELAAAPNNIWNADGATNPFGTDKFSIYAVGTATYAINGYATTGAGVYGQATSGRGVWGVATTGIGVQGSATGANGWGVYGLTDQASGVGVVGINTNGGGPAGYFQNSAAAGNNVGDAVYAQTAQQQGGALFAANVNTSGTAVWAGGNNVANFVAPTGGGGGGFTGTATGVGGFSLNTTGDRRGGTFSTTPVSLTPPITFTHWAEVAAVSGGTNYKIRGTGNVSTVVWSHDNQKRITFFAPEAPEILFMDYGVGQLQNGRAYITLDPDFTHNIYVDEQHPLRVFIQLEDDCQGVYVTNKSERGFEVRELNGGQSNARFVWQVVANRRDEYDPQTGQLVSKHQGVRKPVCEPPTFVARSVGEKQRVIPRGKEVLEKVPSRKE
ncbi:MAG: hypothetical protein KatS3mg025_0604 [Bacteroidia bacterium]|nr:MAG: hypothetical protein KatS3mg025_0604 [Bacteroidia bacterium]